MLSNFVVRAVAPDMWAHGFFAWRRNMAETENNIISDQKPGGRWVDTRGGSVVVKGELSYKVKIGKLSE